MKELLRSRSYVYLISANLINRLGDSVDAIASTWLVYQLTQNPMWSTIIFGSNMVPTIFLQPLAGVFVEKVNKKHIMILVDKQDLFRTIKSTLELYFSDNCKSHTLHSNGTWTANSPQDGEPAIRAQEMLYNKYKEASNLAEGAIPLEFVVRRSN